MDATHVELKLPGFRFHPTEEELLEFYLKQMVSGKNAHSDIIGYLNIYLYDPWVLPGLSKIGEREWYFFVPRDRKQGSGGRPNRTTENGFWKATGSDRKILSFLDPKKVLGLKKTLVFYKGRAPRGNKTDWIMNEYRLPDNYSLAKDIVLCKIYRKATSMKVLEQRAAAEEEINRVYAPIPLSSEETISFYTQSDVQSPKTQTAETPTKSCNMELDNKDEFHQDLLLFLDVKTETESPSPNVISIESYQVASVNDHNEFDYDLMVLLDEQLKQEPDVIRDATSSVTHNYSNTKKVSCLRLPKREEGMLQELQLPKGNMDWTQDSFWTQLCSSPWLENILLSSPYANVLNF